MSDDQRICEYMQMLKLDESWITPQNEIPEPLAQTAQLDGTPSHNADTSDIKPTRGHMRSRSLDSFVSEFQNNLSLSLGSFGSGNLCDNTTAVVESVPTAPRSTSPTTLRTRRWGYFSGKRLPETREIPSSLDLGDGRFLGKPMWCAGCRNMRKQYIENTRKLVAKMNRKRRATFRTNNSK